MSKDWTISTGLVNELSRFQKFQVKEWIDRKEKFCIILIEPTAKEDSDKNYCYNDITFEEKIMSTSDLIAFLQEIINKNYDSLNGINGIDLDGLKSDLSIHDLENLNKDWSTHYCYKAYFEGEMPSYLSPKINNPSWHIFYGLGSGHHYPTFDDPLFDKGAPYYPSKTSALSSLMDINLDLHFINGYIFPGIVFLLPFTNMYIKKMKLLGRRIELEYTDDKILDQYAVKIYYEGNNDFRESIQEEAKTSYLLNNVPYFIGIMLYKKDTGLLIDSIHYPSKSNNLYPSKRIHALTDYEYIASLIEQGESEVVELKGYQNYSEINSKKDDLIETILSFSNTLGGTIIIGVKDDRTIIGFKDLTPFEKLKK
jgi:hypothetical protein